MKSFSNLFSEGSRYAGLRSVECEIEAIRKLRQAVIIGALMVFSWILIAAGLMLVIVQAVESYNEHQGVYPDAIMYAGASMSLLGGVAVFWCMRERTWLALFRIEKQILALLKLPKVQQETQEKSRKVERIHNPPKPKSATSVTKSSGLSGLPGLDVELLEICIDRILEKKLKKRAARRSGGPRSGTEARP